MEVGKRKGGREGLSSEEGGKGEVCVWGGGGVRRSREPEKHDLL